jgi:hypothetical protein
VEDEIMDMCVEWGSSTHSIELESMHAWTHMFGSRWHSSFWGWVGLVWSDSNGDLSVVLLYFRQRKAAEVDLLF